MNLVIISGNLGGDVEVQTSKGTTFARLSIAHNYRVREDDGEWVRRVTWIRATAFGALAKSLAILGKGSKVLVRGRLKKAVFERDAVRFEHSEVIAEHVEFQLVKPRQDGDGGEPEQELEGDEVEDDDDIPF